MAAEADPGRHRELYERFCRQRFRDGGRGCSKTISRKKRDKLCGYLGNGAAVGDVSPHFRFWVKTRGFQLVEMEGERVLCLPNKHWVESDPTAVVQWKKVAAVEEFFDIISTHHVQEDGSHVGIKKTLSKITGVYECLTRTAVEGYIESCDVCHGRARKRHGWSQLLTPPTDDKSKNELSFMSSTQVDLTDMSPHRDGEYQWLGHFTDHWSCFHILFPLSSPSTDEVTQNLCRHVFSLFGLPQALHCNLGRQFTSQVVQSVPRHWQGEGEIEVATQRVHNPALDQATSKLEEMIAEYVVQRPLWTQWLPYLQYTLNTELTAKTVKPGVSRSPFTILLSSVPGVKGEEEEGEFSEDCEEVQLEVVSEALTSDAPGVWQMTSGPSQPASSSVAPPVTESSTAHPTNSAVKERGDEEEKEEKEEEEEEEDEEKGSGGGMAEKGEEGVHDSMSVQQILMPPDSDFLSSFYEAAQLTEGNGRKRKRKQTPVRVIPAATPTDTPATSSS